MIASKGVLLFITPDWKANLRAGMHSDFFQLRNTCTLTGSSRFFLCSSFSLSCPLVLPHSFSFSSLLQV
jgi:hypothetical protein